MGGYRQDLQEPKLCKHKRIDPNIIEETVIIIRQTDETTAWSLP